MLNTNLHNVAMHKMRFKVEDFENQLVRAMDGPDMKGPAGDVTRSLARRVYKFIEENPLLEVETDTRSYIRDADRRQSQLPYSWAVESQRIKVMAMEECRRLLD